MKNTSQRRRAQYGMAMVVVLNLGVYIWSIVMQAQFQRNSPGKIDWDEDLYARSFLPYFFVQTTGPLSQSYMYWLLSSFATDAQGKSEFNRAHAVLINSERQKWCCIPILGSRRSSHRLRHEHTDQDYSLDWIVSLHLTLRHNNKLMISCVTLGLMCAAVVPMVFLVNSTPNDIPADLVAAEIEARRQEEEFPEKEKIGGTHVREV